MRRALWFVSGAVAGIVGAGAARRKARAVVADLTPANVARRSVERLRLAVDEGRLAARGREAELRARLGEATTLADELAAGDAVLVDGRPVEPGQVIVLRQMHDGRTTGPPRRHPRRRSSA